MRDDSMINGIDVVFIHVRNPTKMAKWYKEMLEIEMGYIELGKTALMQLIQCRETENAAKVYFKLKEKGVELKAEDILGQVTETSGQEADAYYFYLELAHHGVEWAKNEIKNYLRKVNK